MAQEIRVAVIDSVVCDPHTASDWYYVWMLRIYAAVDCGYANSGTLRHALQVVTANPRVWSWWLILKALPEMLGVHKQDDVLNIIKFLQES